MARILVIDDDENIRETLSEILKVHNYDVVSACNGREAQPLIHDNPPDLIITDLIMPEMS
ncbi:MAG: response regulator, partial [Candidatus Lokiarchaeota archaeon]|nr:response regulator [Candidatus Lokiarchaeota archaeon]